MSEAHDMLMEPRSYAVLLPFDTGWTGAWPALTAAEILAQDVLSLVEGTLLCRSLAAWRGRTAGV